MNSITLVFSLATIALSAAQVIPVPGYFPYGLPTGGLIPVSVPAPVSAPVPVPVPAPVSVPVSAPVQVAAPAPNVRMEKFETENLSKSEIRDDAGQYSLSYVTSNGIRVTERGFLKVSKEGDYVPVKEGTYQYISPEGVPVAIGYRADENGYVVKGYPLPVNN